MNSMKPNPFIFLTIIFILFGSIKSEAASSEKRIPLFFPADKNNIQVLPQRFEYNLLDEDQIKIGDILINYSTFGFQILPSANFPGQYRARFIWPSGLLQEGAVVIKNNTGKAIWTANFSRKTIRLVSSKSPEEDKIQNKQPRTQVAEMVVDQLNPNLIEDMKYFPFMTFCISNTFQETHINICSKELYLVSQENRLKILPRDQGKRFPLVEINGKSVSAQGIIFLNSESENIGFRAVASSGANLEVETRMKPVDFKDIILSEDKKELILTASGAEPVNEESIKRISKNEWRINLDANRPILYLKGEGNIPMRQEFYIKGTIPSETARPYLKANSLSHIYKSELNLEGSFAPETSIGSNTANEEVEKTANNKFHWRLTEIPSGETSRHYLRVQQDQNSFIAAYDVAREFPFEASLWGSYRTPAGELSADMSATWWIENFMENESSWAHLHWGLSFKEAFMLAKKTGDPLTNISHFEFIWRANSGFHFQDRTWGLSLPYEMIQGTGVSVGSLGLGVFVSEKAQESYQRYFHWYDLKLNYLLGGSSGTLKLKSALRLNAIAYYHLNKRFSWNYGLGANQYLFDPEIPNRAPLQFEITGGATYRF
ncbi:MAG: hypothetical protein ACXWRE_13070 [Pseudobdellovibrionaceae bacterium]